MLRYVNHGGMVKMITKRKDSASFATMTDSVRRCTTPYSGYYQRRMADILREMRGSRKDWLKEADVPIYDAHLEVLEKGSKVVGPAVLELSKFGSVCEFHTYSTYLDGYRHVITDNEQEAEGVVREMLDYPRRFPLIFDTEGAHFDLNHRERTALLTIFDEPSKIVLYWRVHLSDSLDPAITALSNLSKARGLLSFGPEDLIKGAGIAFTDFQEMVKVSFRLKDRPNLKQVAKDLGSIMLNKSETLSDWTVPRLRDDQIEYAFMDVYSVSVAWSQLMEMDNPKDFTMYCQMLGVSVEGERHRMMDSRRRMKEEEEREASRREVREKIADRKMELYQRVHGNRKAIQLAREELVREVEERRREVDESMRRERTIRKQLVEAMKARNEDECELREMEYKEKKEELDDLARVAPRREQMEVRSRNAEILNRLHRIQIEARHRLNDERVEEEILLEKMNSGSCQSQ